MHFSLCNRDFFFPLSLPRTQKRLSHSTICQLPLETFNTNKIYGFSFQRILPEDFIFIGGIFSDQSFLTGLRTHLLLFHELYFNQKKKKSMMLTQHTKLHFIPVRLHIDFYKVNNGCI